jgi:hypothetical protein
MVYPRGVSYLLVKSAPKGRTPQHVVCEAVALIVGGDAVLPRRMDLSHI